VLQNCMIFSNGVHENITGKDVRDDMQVKCEHGKPLIFGKDRIKVSVSTEQHSKSSLSAKMASLKRISSSTTRKKRTPVST